MIPFVMPDNFHEEFIQMWREDLVGALNAYLPFLPVGSAQFNRIHDVLDSLANGRINSVRLY